MTILTSIILVLSIVAVATFIGYYVQRGQPTMNELWEDPNKQQDIIETKVDKSSKVVPEDVALNQEPVTSIPKNKKGHYYSRKSKTIG